MVGVPRLDPRDKIKRQMMLAATGGDAPPVADDEAERRSYEQSRQGQRVDTYAGARANEQAAIDKAKALVSKVMPTMDTEGAVARGRAAGEESAAVARLRANRIAVQQQRAAGPKPSGKPQEFIGDTPIAYSTRWSADKKSHETDYKSLPKVSNDDVAGHLANALKSVPRGSYDSDEKFFKDLHQLGRSVLSNAPQTRDLSDDEKTQITMSALQKLRSDPKYSGKDDDIDTLITKGVRKNKLDKRAMKRSQRTAKHDLAEAAAQLTGKTPREHRATRTIDYANWQDPASGVYKGRKLAFAKALQRAKDNDGDYSRADAVAQESGLNPKTIARIKGHIIEGKIPGGRKHRDTMATGAKKPSKARGMLISKLQARGYSQEDAASMADDFAQSGLGPKKPQEPKPFARPGQYKFRKGR